MRFIETVSGKFKKISRFSKRIIFVSKIQQ